MRLHVLTTVTSTAVLSIGLLLGGAAFAQTSTGSQSNSDWHTASLQDSDASSTNDQSASSATLIDPGKIYNQNPMSWVGKSVTLKDVTVQDTNDSGNFWVGSDSDHRLLIVKPEKDANLAAMRFHKGDIVTVSGVIHPASDYMAMQTTASKGSMNDAKGSSGVFLLATNVDVKSSTQH